MALNFNPIEAVGFGKLKVKPQMTKELELRVKNLKINEANREEVIEILSSCFGTYSTEVKAFMQENMHEYDLVELSLYLAHGDRGLENFRNIMQKSMDKEMDEVVDRVGSENV